MNGRSLFPAICLLLLLPVSMLRGAEGVQITFLPPPLEGTLSAGVYSAEGKLVRVLASEAHDDAFVAGLNGFITTWDGCDAAGAPLPGGSYFVRGFAVGDVSVEGVAFHGNDWLEEDDGPRLRDLLAVQIDGRALIVEGTAVDGKAGRVRLPLDEGQRAFTPREPGDSEPAPQPAREVAGTGGSVWKIEEEALVQRRGEEILRQLVIPPSDPQPFAIAAAPDREEIFLLERNAREVRLRGLRLKETKAEADGKAVSEWEVFISKSIAAQATFEQAASAVDRMPPPVSEERVRIGLMKNELLQVAQASVQLYVAVDEKGSYLRTSEGLPLRRVTATPHLAWATFVREADGSISLFQSDGAVIEEYRLRKLDQMMAFDAGEYEWRGK